MKTEKKIVANNKKAYHDYFIKDTCEAGLCLAGTEVKSIRLGKCSIKEAYVRIEDGEAFIVGMNISPYEQGNIFNRDPLRVRKLLLHKAEIGKLTGAASEAGYTLIPLSVYLADGKVKLEVGVAKGKKMYDKRRDLADKAVRRDSEREFKVRNL